MGIFLMRIYILASMSAHDFQKIDGADDVVVVI